MTMVLSSTPRSLSFLRMVPICSSCSSILARTRSSSARPSSTAIWTYFGIWVRPDMDRGGIKPDEEGLVALAHVVQVFERLVGHFLVESLHALAGERTSVLEFLHPDLSEFWIHRSVLNGRRPGVQHAARAKLGLVFRILLRRVVEFFRFFLGIQVVEIAEPFVETVSGGQELVAVTQMVFADLRGGVTRGL